MAWEGEGGKWREEKRRCSPLIVFSALSPPIAENAARQGRRTG
jgi:hypothetical protein